jgi:hypothetical protein
MHLQHHLNIHTRRHYILYIFGVFRIHGSLLHDKDNLETSSYHSELLTFRYYDTMQTNIAKIQMYVNLRKD